MQTGENNTGKKRQKADLGQNMEFLIGYSENKVVLFQSEMESQ